MLIEELQDTYKLGNEEHNEIYNELRSEVLKDNLRNKECNIIIGPRASGKSTLSKQLSNKGFAFCDRTFIDSRHPDYEKLKQMYPTDYINIIAPDVVKWNSELFDDMMDSGCSFNYETTGNNFNKLTGMIEYLKENEYSINVFFLAVNYLESKLRIYENFIWNMERNIVGRPLIINPLASFANMPDLAEAMDFDDFKSVQFLSKDFAGCKFGSDKELFVNLMRDFNNDVSFIDFYKRAEYITNFIARYPELIREVDIDKILADIDILRCYYDAMNGNNGIVFAKRL